MKGHGEKITRKQEQAIAALLSSPTIREAAQAADVAEVTLWRWLKVRSFTAQYRAARRQVVEQAVARLQQASKLAVDTLMKCLQAKSESVRLRAAVAILEQSAKAIELLDIEERVASLESNLKETR